MKKWDKLQRVRWILKPNHNVCEATMAFSVICDEIRQLKNEIKKIKGKLK